MSRVIERGIIVFFGHQFVSSKQSQVALRNAVNKAVIAAAADWNARENAKVNAAFRALNISSGGIVIDEILKAIDNSQICIFDLSDKNHNTIFELGFASGRDKEIIWICNEELPLKDLPSDFQGKFVLRYDDASDLETKLADEICCRFTSIVKGISGEKAFKEIWYFNNATCVNLVLGRIPSGDRSKFASVEDPNFLRYQSIADIDTLVYISRFLAKNFPHLAQSDFMPSEFRADIDSPLFAIGGPVWNTVAKRYYQSSGDQKRTARLPIQFEVDPSTGEDIIKLTKRDGESLVLRAEGVEANVSDIGIFAKIHDQQNDVPVFVISGLRTGGVLGAAKVLADNAQGNRNCTYLANWDGDLNEFILIFRVFCRVEGAEMTVETPNLNEGTIIYLDCLSK